jgi:methionyl-tRNA formyltransferase
MTTGSSSMSSDRRSTVVLIGRGPTALTALEGLASTFDVRALVRDAVDETARRAGELGVPVVEDTSVQSVHDIVARYRPDAVVVSSYDRILDAELIGGRPFVNVHYAPLPRGRGRATVNWAMINGDDSVTITIHHLVPELDAGGILFQESVPIGPESTVASLYQQLGVLQRRHIAAATAAAIAGDPGVPQDSGLATYYCTRIPDDGEIDWSLTTADIDRLVRALQPPFPAAYTWLGLNQLHVDSASLVRHARTFEGRVPGRVVDVDRKAGTADVLTGDGVLRLRRVRIDDGEQVAAAAAVSSVRMTLGLRTGDLVRELRRVQSLLAEDGS